MIGNMTTSASGKQTVDCEQSGAGRWRLRKRVDAPQWRGCDVQRVVEDEYEDQADPEDRHRHTPHAKHSGQVVPDAVTLDSADDAKRDGNQEGQNGAERGQLETGGQPLIQVKRDRITCVPRLPEVAVDQPGHIQPELDR